MITAIYVFIGLFLSGCAGFVGYNLGQKRGLRAGISFGVKNAKRLRRRF